MSQPREGTRVAWRPVHGVLLADKPQGISSNGFLQQLRRLYRAAKGGHAGTLDPMATGLLVVCFGESAKFSSWLLESAKAYEGSIALGTRTSTGDAEGEVLEQKPASLENVDLEALAARFTGELEQVPPMVSALKRDGRPLYAYAREGIVLERPPRHIRIDRLLLRREGSAGIGFEVDCSTGTYVRSLAEDLAAALGTVGHLTRLRRTASGPFRIAQASRVEDLEGLDETGRDRLLLPAETLPYRLERLAVDAAEALALVQGRTPRRLGLAAGRYRVAGPDGDFLGVVEADAGGVLRAVRLMATGTGAG